MVRLADGPGLGPMVESRGSRDGLRSMHLSHAIQISQRWRARSTPVVFITIAELSRSLVLILAAHRGWATLGRTRIGAVAIEIMTRRRRTGQMVGVRGVAAMTLAKGDS